MTDIANMTPEEKRIAMACGWTVVETEHFKVLYPPGLKHYGFPCGLHLTDNEVWRVGLAGDENGNYRFPDYLNHLNPLHEAEKTLTHEQRDRYARLIGRHDTWLLVHATAAEKADAFLRTIQREGK